MKKRFSRSVSAFFTVIAITFSIMWMRSYGRSTALFWTSAQDKGVNHVSHNVGVAWIDGRFEFGDFGWSGGPLPGWHAWDQAKYTDSTFLPHQGPGYALPAISTLVALFFFSRSRIHSVETQGFPVMPCSPTAVRLRDNQTTMNPREK